MKEKTHDIASKLRAEINNSKNFRHTFILRKFAFGTSLMGLGALTIKNGQGLEIELSILLYIVPLVAIAFDLYIFSEDFRIVRAGLFINSKMSGATSSEKKWEEFINDHPNQVSIFSFFWVTVIYIVASAVLLCQTQSEMNLYLFWIWLVLVIISELAIVLLSKYNRNLLKEVIEK